MDNQNLTGGVKFGYVALGFFLGLIGVLIAWLIERGKPAKREAIKFSVIGFVISVVIWCIMYFAVFAGLMATGGLSSY